jgi:hypothetical protein
MPLIIDSEMEDFEAAILQAGFEVNDFSVVDLEDDELSLKDDESTVIVQHSIIGTVTVHRISSDVSETYRPGSGSDWQQDFEAELKAGKFGQP